MAKGVVLTTIKSSNSNIGNLVVYGEEATGVKNNSNTIFNTLYAYESGTLCIYYNGQRLGVSAYVESDIDEFQLVYIKPHDVDKLLVDYVLQST